MTYIQPVAVCATHRNMRTNLEKWLAAALKHADNMSQADLARKLSKALRRDLDRSMVHKMANGTRGIKADELFAIAKITGYPAPVEKNIKLGQVNIVGVIGAGEEILAFDDEPMGGGDPIDAPPKIGPNAIAVRVRGDSMFPDLDDGDVLVYDQRFESDFDQFIGRRVVIGLEDGTRLVKRLHKGSSKGLYTLRSSNPRVRDIEDVPIAWIAPIQWVKPKW